MVTRRVGRVGVGPLKSCIRHRSNTYKHFHRWKITSIFSLQPWDKDVAKLRGTEQTAGVCAKKIRGNTGMNVCTLYCYLSSKDNKGSYETISVKSLIIWCWIKMTFIARAVDPLLSDSGLSRLTSNLCTFFTDGIGGSLRVVRNRQAGMAHVWIVFIQFNWAFILPGTVASLFPACVS